MNEDGTVKIRLFVDWLDLHIIHLQQKKRDSSVGWVDDPHAARHWDIYSIELAEAIHIRDTLREKTGW